MEFSPCYTYHSVYPKCQAGSYASFFNIEQNQENLYFVQNPWKQSPCLGTQVICFDTKYGALAPGQVSAVDFLPPGKVESLRAQALYNQPLRQIIASRPQAN